MVVLLILVCHIYGNYLWCCLRSACGYFCSFHINHFRTLNRRRVITVGRLSGRQSTREPKLHTFIYEHTLWLRGATMHKLNGNDKMLCVKRNREMPLLCAAARTNCPRITVASLPWYSYLRVPLPTLEKFVSSAALHRILWVLNCCGVRSINFVHVFSWIVEIKVKQKKTEWNIERVFCCCYCSWGLCVRERHCHCHRRRHHLASFNHRVCFTMAWKTTRT